MTSPNPYQLQRVAARDVEPLLGECFPVKKGTSFFDDFPIWSFGPAVEWFAVSGPQGLVACAGWMAGEWQGRSGTPLLKVARIGGVATHPSLRGKGVASVLVEALVERARIRDQDAVALWGVESPLYGKLGFESRGRQVRAPLGPLELEVSRVPGIFRLEEGFDPSLLSLLQKTRQWAGGMKLGLADLQWLGAHPNVRWARVLNAGSEPVAYGAFSRGIDLGVQLHDWGGQPEALRMIFRWARGLDPQSELMGPPWAIQQTLGMIPESRIEETSCMFLALSDRAGALVDDQIWFWGFDGV